MKQQIPEGGNRVSANFLFKGNEIYVIILRYYRNLSMLVCVCVCMYVRAIVLCNLYNFFCVVFAR